MMRLARIVARFQDAFLAAYGERLDGDQQRALAAIRECRSEASPRLLAACGECEQRRWLPHSCGHRACPHCQHHESQQWLERQQQKALPADYFLLTFTLPAELRGLVAAHRATSYDLLLRCAWETVKTFSQNDRQLAGTPGAVAVLHTHTRQLEYHPHVHLLMPAGAVDRRSGRWRTKRRSRANGRYLFSHKALAKVFRAKVLAGLAAAGLPLPARHPPQWVVDCRAVGAGDTALVYLGRYLYRGVIGEADILACEGDTVTFRYRDARSGKTQRRTLSGVEFLWKLMQHVLPRGLRRARNFGLLHPNSKRLIALLQTVLRYVPRTPPTAKPPRPAIVCPGCGAPMRIVLTRQRPAPRPNPGVAICPAGQRML